MLTTGYTTELPNLNLWRSTSESRLMWLFMVAAASWSPPHVLRTHFSARMVATVAPTADTLPIVTPLYSGLKGKALAPDFLENVPTKAEVRLVVPDWCYQRDTLRSLSHLLQSLIATGVTACIGLLIPLKLVALPLWMAYALGTGTAAMGLWVLAHECGHGAFSDNRFLQDAVGFVLHSVLLVPYFSWQRSHAVHHSKTNHVLEGETHVPYTMESGKKTLAKREFFQNALGERLGDLIYGGIRCVSHLVFGWPAYLLAGVTGGPVRGVTNHFIPIKPFSTGDKNTELFPGVWKNKVRFKMCYFVVVYMYLSIHIQRKKDT